MTHSCNPGPPRLRQGDSEVEASLGYAAKPGLKDREEGGGREDEDEVEEERE